MKLINQLVSAGLKLRHVSKNVYGVEIELENYKGEWDWDGTSVQGVSHWDIVGDPSLRHGIELVSKKLTQRQLVSALSVVQQSINKMKLKTSTRCGIHVHVNMLNLTWGQMWSFMALYTFMEPSLFAKFAPSRDENHFCVPMHWNTRMVEDLSRDATMMRLINVGELPKIDPSKGIKGNKSYYGGPTAYGNSASKRWFPAKKYLTSLGKAKYAALTTYRTNDLGTLESRVLPGTVNMEDILLWVSVLGRLKHMAYKFIEPLDLQKRYEREGSGFIWTALDIGPEPKIKSRDRDEAEECAYKIIGVAPTAKEKYNWDLPK